MNSKRVMGLSVSFVAGLLLISLVLPALAHLGSPINSKWATTVPTINGVMGAGEWSDAVAVDFVFEMRSRTDGSLLKTLNGRLYVKNNWNNLYIAVLIFNDDYEAQDAMGRYNGLYMFFEDNHDGVLAVGDNGEGITTWVGSPFYSHNDLYYAGASFWDADFYALMTNDGSAAFSHTNPVQGNLGDWTFEMLIPLVGSDGDAYDFAITSLPKTVGFKLRFEEPNKGSDGVFPDDPAITKNIEEVSNGTTYGNLIIHPLYTLTIIAGPGGTTNPAPGQYQYPYGTVVPVQAIPSPGFLFDHWELDTVNVGSTNPYSVTMDQNHTLKAFFKPISIGPVGGSSVSLTQKGSVISFACYGALFGIFSVAAIVIRRKKK